MVVVFVSVLQPGALIAGKYRLLSLIGEGAMGAVWSARNELTQRVFALKLLSAQHVGGVEARKRLLREASASGQLTHRNVVEVYDVGVTEEGDPFLVMQLLKGEALDALLHRAGRLEPARAIEIAASVARALDVAHAVGVVHRDLKPGNIFLHQDPDLGIVVKVLDFGVSKMLSADTSSTMTGTAVGSPAYMSPEQAKGEKTLDHRTDIWALGVVLFEMLAGKRPFRGETPYAVVSDIITARIPSVSEIAPTIDARLVDLVARCLERDVSKRIATAKDVLALLASLGARARVDSLSDDAKVPVAPVTGALAGVAIATRTPEAGTPEAPVAPAVTARDENAVRDPTHTSTAALVASWRGSWPSQRAIAARFGSIHTTLARALSGLSRRAVLQISLAAGASFFVVIGAVIFRTTSTGTSAEPSGPPITQEIGAVPLAVRPELPPPKPKATSARGAGAGDAEPPIDVDDLPHAEPGTTADAKKSDEKKEPATTKPAVAPKKKSTPPRPIAPAPKPTAAPGIPPDPWLRD